MQDEALYQRVGRIPADVLTTHPPVPLRAQGAPRDSLKVVEREHEAANGGGRVHHDGVVGHTAERLACLSGLDDAVCGQVHRCLFAVVVPVAALDRNAQNLRLVGRPGYEVDSGMVDPGAFVAVFGQPVQDETLSEVPAIFECRLLFLRL